MKQTLGVARIQKTGVFPNFSHRNPAKLPPQHRIPFLDDFHFRSLSQKRIGWQKMPKYAPKMKERNAETNHAIPKIQPKTACENHTIPIMREPLNPTESRPRD